MARRPSSFRPLSVFVAPPNSRQRVLSQHRGADGLHRSDARPLRGFVSRERCSLEFASSFRRTSKLRRRQMSRRGTHGFRYSKCAGCARAIGEVRGFGLPERAGPSLLRVGRTRLLRLDGEWWLPLSASRSSTAKHCDAVTGQSLAAPSKVSFVAARDRTSERRPVE